MLTAFEALTPTATSIPSPPPTPPSRNSSPIQVIVENILRPSHLTVHQMEDILGHLHRIRHVRLSNGSSLILKVSPPQATPLLRHEQYALDTEAIVFSLLAKSNLPIPRVLKYDARCINLGSPFLLTRHLPGISYANVRQYLTRSERAGIERQLKSLVGIISQHTSSIYGPYGPVSLVASNQGHKSWREAFVAMLESSLMDAEDIMVSLPYAQIREQVSRMEGALDVVKEAKLVVLGFGQPENVLIDRRTNEVTGLLDFGRAIWGDCEMGETEGSRSAKRLLYICYEAVVTIVTHHYRPQRGAKELDARKSLTMALTQLATE